MLRREELRRPQVRKYEIVRGEAACIRNSSRLLRSAKALLDVEPMHALVLYSVAVEEFGKMKWLHELESLAQDGVSIDIPDRLFKDHSEKLRRGFGALPLSCSSVMHGVRLLMNSVDQTKRIWYNPGPIAHE